LSLDSVCPEFALAVQRSIQDVFQVKWLHRIHPGLTLLFVTGAITPVIISTRPVQPTGLPFPQSGPDPSRSQAQAL